jgi:hypothetical protein
MPVMPERSPEASPLGFHSPHDHTQLISEEAVERIFAKIARLPPIRVADISSTYYGGGVSEILLPITLSDLINPTSAAALLSLCCSTFCQPHRGWLRSRRIRSRCRSAG